MYKILDAHCHIYPDKIAQKASDATGTFYGMPSKMDGTVATLLEEGKKAGISHFLVQSVATTPHQVSRINRFISESVEQRNGLKTGFGTMHQYRKLVLFTKFIYFKHTKIVDFEPLDVRV